MCGIAGFSLSPTSNVDAVDLSRGLLAGIANRGGDATGAGWVDADGLVYHDKAPLRAYKFVDGGRHTLLAGAGAAILHTRAATQGSPTRDVNNHPINLGGILGVHNGVIWNDDSVARDFDITREGEVDSEVIFHLIRDHGVAVAARELSGSASIAWFEWDTLDVARDDDRTLHVARLGGSPLATCQLDDGSFVFSSTVECLKYGLSECHLWHLADRVGEVAYGRHLTVRDGDIVHVETVNRVSAPMSYKYAATHAASQTPTAPTRNLLGVSDDMQAWFDAEDRQLLTMSEQANLDLYWECQLDEAEFLRLAGPAPINRLLDALDDDDAAELRDLFADTALPGRAVAHAINTVYGDHAVLVSWGKVLTEGQVQKWRHDNL